MSGRGSSRAVSPFDRVYDPLIDDLVDGGELSHLRFPTRWPDTPALERLVAAKRAPLDAALHRELVDYHRRLGASTASLASLDRLARGEAVCAVAGQQPAPLGGPLYSLHKTAVRGRARRRDDGAHRRRVRADVLDARRGLGLRRDPHRHARGP